MGSESDPGAILGTDQPASALPAERRVKPPTAEALPGERLGSSALHAKGTLHEANRKMPESARLPSMFNEPFLFDDELESADDSTFVRKYNLSTEDDDFPTLLRPNSQFSSFSSALDLAPSSHVPRHEPSDSVLPAWLHASERVKPENAAPGTPARRESYSNGFQALGQGLFERQSAFLGSELFDGRTASLGFPASHIALVNSRPSSFSGVPSSVPVTMASGLPTTVPATVPNGVVAPPGLAPAAAVPGSVPPTLSSLSPGITPPLTTGLSPGLAATELGSSPNNLSDRTTPPSDFDATRFARFPRKDERRGKSVRSFSEEETYARGLRRSDVDLSAMRLDDLRGELSQLCRDQYGCRFLQKKLDEGIPSQCDLIFSETFPFFAELMTDPFGNYLCQKLLEYCSNTQRDQIVEAIAPELVKISLNMHGTRAVQKTIDFISTPAQTQAIIAALSRNVVTLIKDLNGNHVIQKCLNRLSAKDNQFIYDAVALKCMDVATHRHGCCVLQRCIDHASEPQRLQLVKEITQHALALVQDPFGNYVVQYVLDLDEPAFTEAITRQFLGSVRLLSAQKFSSNVVEKCIRVAPPQLRAQLIGELMDATSLESLLRDSFANYVVQTSLDCAEPLQRMQLVECIRPILPSIRNTPYGKRIQSKLQRDGSESFMKRSEPRSGGNFSRAPRPPFSTRMSRSSNRRKDDHFSRPPTEAHLYVPPGDAAAPLLAPLGAMDISTSSPLDFPHANIALPTRAKGPW